MTSADACVTAVADAKGYPPFAEVREKYRELREQNLKVLESLSEADLGSVPVVADHECRKLVGMISDRDLCRSIIADGLDPQEITIVKFVSSNPVTCRDGENLDKCERAMQEHQLRRIPVVDGEGHCIGIVAQDLALKTNRRRCR
jgi:CBS domain-containing protein